MRSCPVFMRAMYSASVVFGSSDSSWVLAKRSSGRILSRFEGSSPVPSFSTGPNSFQNAAYFSGSSLASRARRSSARFVSAARIASTSASFCSSSRETLSGRSFESSTPRMKRRYIGRNCSASSMMNTRRT